MAHDRSAWCTAVKKGAAKAETKRASDVEIKRQRCHERVLALANQTNHTVEENWRLILANYPMKELVRENIE